MGGSRSRTPSTDPTPAGLSRRGWILLVSVTAGVMLAAAAVAVIATAAPAGHAGAVATPTSDNASPHVPTNPGPTPLRLPPRPTATQVATVPSRPVESLQPGDCLQVYTSQWEAAYPVVDCAAPHIAQLLSRGALPQPSAASFPGTQALDAQVGDLCESHLDWDWVRVWNEDVQVDLRYPDTAAKWASGDRSYDCFVYTYSRHELTGSAVAAG